MPTFVTTTTGGSWTGGGTTTFTCNTAQRNQVNTALATIQRIIFDWGFPCLIGLRNELLDFLNCTLEINCDSSCPSNIVGYSGIGSGRINLCTGAFTGTQQRLNAIIFHEMIHAAGGTELDAEALENHFFAGRGATTPTASDWDDFHDDGGEFVIWDEDTGRLFERCVESGAWYESDTVTRGDQLTPIFIEPDGGDGGSWI